MRKKIFSLLFALLVLGTPAAAGTITERGDSPITEKPESVAPSCDTKIVRRCRWLDIEGEMYDSVTVSLKSKRPDYWARDEYQVEVLVKNMKEKIVYKKTFNNAYLYIFSNGAIYVGKPRFHRVEIEPIDYDGMSPYGIIREEEGVW